MATNFVLTEVHLNIYSCQHDITSLHHILCLICIAHCDTGGGIAMCSTISTQTGDTML